MTTSINAASPGRSLALRLLGALRARRQAAVARRIERVTHSELAALNDRLLSDMGLRRGDILDVARATAGIVPSPGRLLLGRYL